MRKRIITQGVQDALPPGENWLDLENLAVAELTSEDASHPIESAFKFTEGPGWRASETGQQTVRLLFDKPLRVRRIYLVFREDEQERTHEFVLRWSADGGQSYQEIVRQQYTFSSPHNNVEIEDYAVDLVGLTALELTIVPDITGTRPFVGRACYAWLTPDDPRTSNPRVLRPEIARPHNRGMARAAGCSVLQSFACHDSSQTGVCSRAGGEISMLS